MEKADKKQIMVEEIWARFENNKALYSTIGNLLEEMEKINSIGFLKIKLREIINLTFVVDTISKQIDKELETLIESI